MVVEYSLATLAKKELCIVSFLISVGFTAGSACLLHKMYGSKQNWDPLGNCDFTKKDLTGIQQNCFRH